MKTFDVYHPWKLVLTQATGAKLTDETGKNYLDFYGGHGVISIGHNHPKWKNALTKQLDTISYYSNAVTIRQQEEVSQAFAEVSGLRNYSLFLCNSGAEANENALKLAAFHTGRSKVLAFDGAFHGRTAGALAVTDNPNIVAPFGKNLDQTKVPLNDPEAVLNELSSNSYAAVIIEGIQGVAGVFEGNTDFWKTLKNGCEATGTLLIADEIQSGCGRTGDYFAFQHHTVRPDMITMAKGIGNGFPVAAVLIDEAIPAKKGQLGTTFGGSYLACAALQSVLDELKEGKWIPRAKQLGQQLKGALSNIEGVEEVRGRGLMLGIKTPLKATDLQQLLLAEGIVTGNSTCPNTLRILPPLTITDAEIQAFLNVFEVVLATALKPQTT